MRRVLALSLLLLAVLASATPVRAAARASAAPPRVLILGDSITEGVGLAHPRAQGLAAQTARFARHGARSVFVPAHSFAGASAQARAFFGIGRVTSVTYSAGWQLDGGFDDALTLLPDGSSPLGLSSTPLGSASRLSFPARTPAVEVLYSASRPGAVTATVGGRRTIIGLPATPGAAFRLPIPAGTTRATLSRWSRGLRFGGLVQDTWSYAEILGVGRTGLRMSTPVTAQERAAQLALRPTVTVIALGTNDVFALGRPRDYRAGLARRAALAHRTGACVVLAPADLGFAPSIVAQYRAVGRAEARRDRCRWSTAFARAFAHGRADIAAGLLHTDAVHPTAAGQRRFGRLLAADLGL